jgi:hypothetical protein
LDSVVAEEDEVPRSITGTLPRRRSSHVAALLAAPAAALLSGLLLSACSAGQISQTDTMVPAVPGANADSAKGVASLRDVQVKYNPQGYQAGAVAPLIVYVVNNDINRPLVLRGVTAAVSKGGPSLGTVVLAGGTVDVEQNQSAAPSASASHSASPSASAPASTSPSASPAGSAKPSASATPSGSPSATPSASPSGNAVINLTIPPNSFARLAPDAGGYLAINSIAQAIGPGSTTYLTFTFDQDEPVELSVPFGLPLTPLPRLEPSGTSAAE